MDFIKFTGKTKQDAIDKAINELGVSQEDLEIEVIEEGSKGILGLIGAKDVVIQVAKKNNMEQVITKFLKDVYKTLDIDPQIKITSREESILVEVLGEEATILIGRHGESLEGLQTILNIVVTKETGEHTRILLDIQGYRERREESLIAYAKKMAQKAISQRRNIRLDAMNPYERRLIHSSLQDISEITTFSEGEEPNRRIVLALKKGAGSYKGKTGNRKYASNRYKSRTSAIDIKYTNKEQYDKSKLYIDVEETNDHDLLNRDYK